MRCLLGCLMFGMVAAPSALADITVFTCRFPGLRGTGAIFVTIYDDGSPARVGVEVGVGSKAQTYFDASTGATVVVEFNGVGVPDTLTTINQGGKSVHSRHLLSVPKGWFLPSQYVGQCDRRTIR